MRIGVDAMGGDHAPHEVIRGVGDGLQHLSEDDRIVLYGVEDQVRAELDKAGVRDERVEVVHCSQVIGMDEAPVEALRHKRDSSIARMAQAAGKGELDGLISAGNTGAFAAACQLRIRTLPGVSRPGIAVVLPTFHGPVVVCDVGANVAPKPHHLHQYARMCSLYAEHVLGRENPQVGIVSIGEEAGKGNTLVKDASALFRADDQINFIGNVEGRDLFAGSGEVFICDGFVGNVILKLTEGLAEGLFKTIVREFEEEGPELKALMEPHIANIWKQHDFAEYGGAPLLGLNSVAIICHGRSDHRAFGNAVRVAAEEVRVKLIDAIAQRMASAPEAVE
ncbi:MAG: phosphate acyltransferase PlsX [Planctomycetota bacterium]|nr:MAG: phosphate acyltransferase PlsX [Planctomycetota bacterium]